MVDMYVWVGIIATKIGLDFNREIVKIKSSLFCK